MNMVGAAVDPGSAAVQNAGWRSSATRVLKRILRGDAGTLMRWRTGAVRFGSLRRLTPISKTFGFDRGLPIDRFYIESFLRASLADIHGRTLEVADNAYTCKFGAGHVVQSDVLHAESGNPAATIVADLSRGEGLPSEAFDCIILTQTLQMIYDLRTSLRLLCEALKPGGVLLATVPGISQISRHDMDRWGDYWRFTTLSAQRLFEDAGPMDVTVKAYGNVLAAVAFLHGLAAEELREDELNWPDPDYELLIAVRAVKRRLPEAC
jgi:SAM-dependent methyltransferase